MTEQSKTLKSIGRWVGITFSVSIFIWLILLLTTAAQVRNAAPEAAHRVHFAGIVLNTITKHTDAAGDSVHFRFESGWIPYLAGWLILGAITGSAQAGRAEKKQALKS